jgi:hypothetical protein
VWRARAAKQGRRTPDGPAGRRGEGWQQAAVERVWIDTKLLKKMVTKLLKKSNCNKNQ